MRKLASVQKVQEIKDIENADAIQAYRVLGWWVVGKKNEFRVGDLVLYFEIDSFIPHELAPFLSKGRDPREYNGVQGERLRTVRLRGQISQGLIIALHDADLRNYMMKTNAPSLFDLAEEGMDLTQELNIQKWEPPVATNLAGQVRGHFPTHILPRTDQERIQNIFQEIQDKGDVTYEVSLKLDGTSCSIFRYEDELRVCSRNLELKVNQENSKNTLVKIALAVGENIPDGYAVQGEVMGPSIQNNREGFKQHEFFVFDLYDIAKQEYVTPAKRRLLCDEWGLQHVPIIDAIGTAPENVDAGLEFAEGPSINHKIREGLVYKCNSDPNFSFKIISNQFLLKEK